MTYPVDQKLAIAVFVKTPGMSPAKTRLGKSIGQDKAEEFYLHCLNILDQRLTDFKTRFSSTIEVYWSVAEEDGLDAPIWQNHLRIFQGSGSLGQKLFNTQEQLFLRHKKVAFIGADLPQIPLDPLLEFSRSPYKNTIQYGPSEDGGFYLYMSDRSFSKNVWQNVEYSSNQTLKQLREQMIQEDPSIVEQNLLPKFQDVDEISDLKSLKTNSKIDSPDYKSLRIFLDQIV